jgi:hypothetical protein
MKTCNCCHETKELTDFAKKNQKYYRAHCKACAVIKARERRARRPGCESKAKKTWRSKNPAYNKFAEKTRLLRKENRVPTWADIDAMFAVYAEAHRLRARGEDVAVDHIVPLRGDRVSGLHNQFNLQVIDAEWNRIKGNEWWPDMP